MTIVEIQNGRVKGYLTTVEFAKRCAVEESTIRAWIKRRKIDSLKIGKENWIKEDVTYPNRKKRCK